jgi:hypothetical protein
LQDDRFDVEDVSSMTRDACFKPLSMFNDIEWKKVRLRDNNDVGPLLAAFETKHDMSFGSLILCYREPTLIQKTMFGEPRFADRFISRGTRLFNSEGNYN